MFTSGEAAGDWSDEDGDDALLAIPHTALSRQKSQDVAWHLSLKRQSSYNRHLDDDRPTSAASQRRMEDKHVEYVSNKPLELSYFEAAINPDKPRFVRAVYDSQKPKQTKSANERGQLQDHSEKRTTVDHIKLAGIYFGLWVALIAFTIGAVSLHLRSGIMSLDRPHIKTKDSALSLVSGRSYRHDYLHGNPALGFRPLNNDDTNLIWFIPGHKHPETWVQYSGALDAYLDSKIDS